jgi:ATP-GRASP peptide maturase of grasp-with-spasm system
LNETARIGDLFQFILERKNKISSYYTADNNKLIHTIMAKEAGLDVPGSLICSSQKELTAFFNQYPKGIISKPISDSFTLHEQDRAYLLFTNVVTQKDIIELPETFAPTLFQQKIEKTCELRVFYLKGQVYAMAIFSQNDDKTKVDFRRYNKEKQNYRVPFNLPLNIKQKLKKFMRFANLDCGSIDIVYSQDGRYYFLEVNPVGQFAMVSIPCNYHLGQKIALELSKRHD